MTIKTFMPSGGGAATVSAATSVASASAALDQYSNCVRVYNSGATAAFIRFTVDASTATLTDMPLAPGATEVFTKGTCTVASAILASGTGTVYFTNGEGL